MLLVAVLALVQVCTGFMAAVAYAANMPAAIAADGCCGDASEPGCAAAQDTAGPFSTCSVYCTRDQGTRQSHAGPPVPAGFGFAGPPLVGRVVFASQLPRLDAAPRAASSTPLIYQLQRLLN